MPPGAIDAPASSAITSSGVPPAEVRAVVAVGRAMAPSLVVAHATPPASGRRQVAEPRMNLPLYSTSDAISAGALNTLA